MPSTPSPAPPPSDRELVAEARGGRTAPFDALIHRHFDSVFAIALARLRHREAAEDVAQEVFLRAWLHLEALRDGERFAPWVHQMARNLAANRHRDGERARRLVPLVPQQPAQNAEQIPDGGMDVRMKIDTQRAEEALQRALQALPEEDRTLVRLHFLEQKTQREVAEHVGTHHSTISRRLERAVGRLRSLLGGAPVPATLPARRATCALVAGLVALPAARQAEIVIASEATGGALTTASVFPALPAVIQPLVGALVMSTLKKLTLTTAAVLLIGGGTYTYLHQGPGGGASALPAVNQGAFSATPDKQVFVRDGTETSFALTPGKTVRLTFEKVPLPDERFRAEYGDIAAVDFTTEGNGRGLVRLTRHTNPEPISFEITPQTASLATIQLGPEIGRTNVRIAYLRQTDEGLVVDFFQNSTPDVLAPMMALRKEFETGKVSNREAFARAQALFERASLLPKASGPRTELLGLLRHLVN